MSKIDLSSYYDSTYFEGGNKYDEGYKGYTFQKMCKGFESKVKTIRKYCALGKILDVGCAKGFFVKIALDWGYDAYGIDFSAYAVSEAQKLVGNRVIRVDLEQQGIPFREEEFDLITGWDLLEHLKNPESFLEKAHTLLKPNGYLFLTTLNYGSLMSRLMRSNWLLKNPLHLSAYITPKLLRRLLKNTGFQPLLLSTFMLAFKPLPEKLKILQAVLDRIVWAGTPLLRTTCLGDCLLCVAKKI